MVYILVLVQHGLQGTLFGRVLRIRLVIVTLGIQLCTMGLRAAMLRLIVIQSVVSLGIYNMNGYWRKSSSHTKLFLI